MDRIDIKSLRLDSLKMLMSDLGEPMFRAGQIYAWLHRRQITDFAEMTDLSAALREKLSEKCYINAIQMKKKLVSDMDGTVKYLYELRDGNCVEAVRMQHHHGTSLCISTQVGCRMGCRFCASTLGGLVRSLTASEMLDQVYASGVDAGKRIDSVVLMGIGEPLDNMDAVLDFLMILSSPEGLNLSLRHVSLSTCGLVDKIDRLAEYRLPLTLSVSLHAPDNESRSAIMPVNRRWPVEDLLAACKRYFDMTGRRISFEYALIAGQNDTPAHAKALAKRLAGMPCHVNLIPVNYVPERGYQRSTKDAIRRFQKMLEDLHINATIRRELGSDIAAACGQLRNDSKKEIQNGQDPR